jgi:hypothetical protein
MLDDGYNSMFIANFAVIIITWVTSFALYLCCLLIVKYLESIITLSKYTTYKGWALTFYVAKFRVLSFIKATIEPFTESFVTTGMLRIFIQTAYDMNFSIFLDLNNSKLSSHDYGLWFSSVLCVVVLAIEVVVIY